MTATLIPVRLPHGNTHLATEVSTSVLGQTEARCGALLMGKATIECPPQIPVCRLCVPDRWWLTVRVYRNRPSAVRHVQRQYTPTDTLLWRTGTDALGNYTVQVADANYWHERQATTGS